ncbi:MAG: hypothetical protein FWF01_01715 [Alphaproteobacteria bacterium]|nr:hypothetical protein [Alphaproteobacteria bacterium]
MNQKNTKKIGGLTARPGSVDADTMAVISGLGIVVGAVYVWSGACAYALDKYFLGDKAPSISEHCKSLFKFKD